MKAEALPTVRCAHCGYRGPVGIFKSVVGITYSHVPAKWATEFIPVDARPLRNDTALCEPCHKAWTLVEQALRHDAMVRVMHEMVRLNKVLVRRRMYLNLKEDLDGD